ncbi:hypothetical protein [Chitinophaga sp. sic0106]|uniref:hypothetical protein n=1 Tax=Chitinophaga sp. sic0106 TaxID=2854785 RepID=UPI001C497821|nr:hypothetical protein [Chitinophaga sp. sic0106]MBV7531317.1 hypothetical protein [Chitinophaga sp. sic0106]
METLTLQEDAISTVNRKVYAAKGTRVTLVAEHGDVLIVQSSKGERFPIHITNIKTQ